VELNDGPYDAAPDKTSIKIECQWLRSVPKSSCNSSSRTQRRKSGKRAAFTDRTNFEMRLNVRQRLGTLDMSSKRIENSLSKLCGIIEESSGRL
jgi:ubiquitin